MESTTLITADVLNALFDSCRELYSYGTLEYQGCWATIVHIFEVLNIIAKQEANMKDCGCRVSIAYNTPPEGHEPIVEDLQVVKPNLLLQTRKLYR